MPHASSFCHANGIELLFMSRIQQDPKPRPAVSSELTHAATEASADPAPKASTQDSTEQPGREDRLVQEGDSKQDESENLNDTSSEHELDMKVTVEEVVIPGDDTSDEHMNGNDNEQDQTTSPSPSPPPQRPRSSESFTAVVLVTVTALTQFSIGSTLAWSYILTRLAKTTTTTVAATITIHTTTTVFNTELHLSHNFLNLSEYLLMAGLVAVLMLSGLVVSRLGRRCSLIAATLLSAGGWALHALAANVSLFLVGRVLAGFSAGLLKVAVTTYVMEVTAVSARGQALVTQELMTLTGVMLCLVLSLFLPWYHIAFINLVWMIGCCIAILFFPESPAYLMMNEKQVEAHDVMQRLRTSDSNVDEELLIIKSINPREKAEKGFNSLFRQPFISHMMALMGLLVVSVFSGSAIIMINGAEMLLQAGFNGSYLRALTLVLVSLVCGSIFLFGLVDRIGRRLCFLVSMMILVLTCGGLGGISYVESIAALQDPSSSVPTLSSTWVVVRVCLILLSAFSLSLGTHTVPTILAAEYFPAYCRPQGLSAFFTVYFVLQILSLHLQPLIEETLGLSGLYWLFGVMALLGIVYINFCVYEIKYTMHRLTNTCWWLYRENFYEPRPLI